MKKIPILLLLSLFFIIACKQTTTKENLTNSSTLKPLSKEDFTPYEKIDPTIYFATPDNIAKDPNNALMDIFRKKKAADMANPAKPRPLAKEEINQIENISHQQPWTPVEEVFQFDWQKIKPKEKANLEQVLKTRLVFDNADLKVAELAIASGATLPMHAQATPSVYLILGGEGEVMSNDSTAKVYTGTSIKFDSYEKKKVIVTSKEPLKILWFSWAPEGDKAYLESGYYLTGSNLNVQSMNGILPENFEFWEKEVAKPYELLARKTNKTDSHSSFIKGQNRAWVEAIKNNYYPNTPTFKSASEIEWVDIMNIDPKSFFFAKDLKSLGSTMEMMSRFAKIKSVFRVKRPDSGYDLNYSYLAWGPQSKYITHSHAICEFYYLLEGDVEYIINKEVYHAVPGNFYFHPPYYDHEMRGLKEGVPFLSISGSWIPFGKRELFYLPFLLLEEIEDQSDKIIPENFDFHDFKMKKGMEYGVF